MTPLSLSKSLHQLRITLAASLDLSALPQRAGRCRLSYAAKQIEPVHAQPNTCNHLTMLDCMSRSIAWPRTRDDVRKDRSDALGVEG